MKLKKMILKNYRSIGEDEQEIDFENLTMFIGNNSVGKTAALSALNKLFSDVPNDRVLKRSDFHLPKGIQPENFKQQELIIEAIFEFDELLDNQIESSPAIPIFFESFVVDSPGSLPKLRIRLEASWEYGNTVEGTIESNIYFITCPETSEVNDDNKKNASRHDLNKIRLIYVPAVRDPSKQLKSISGSMIHQVMNSVNWKDETRSNIKKNIDKINEDFSVESGVNILKTAIQKEWYEYQSDTRYTKAELKFNATNIDTAIKNIEVLFSPTETGREYSIDEMGDGMKSLFYMSIVDSILDVEAKINEEMVSGRDLSFTKEPPVLTIVAVEEPENHISPHILGKLVNKLRNISEKANAQTIVTSHSPVIVKRINPEEIRHFRMNYETLSTAIKKLTLPDNETNSDQYKYVKEAVKAYPEIYFAKLVIFGEGDSEEIVLPKFFEADGSGLDSSGVSIVPLGGRHVNHFWRLVADLGIPHITLLDLDREREGGGWGRIKYVIKQLLKIGIDREKLLKLKSGKILDDASLSKMHSWDVTNIDNMNNMLTRLEKHNVYFSSPLDIDFLMLESYGEDYISTISDREGPRIKLNDISKKVIDLEDSDKELEEFKERIAHDVGRTLKNDGAVGIAYSDTQKEMMLWYNYFFLNRGKPSTHIAVLSKISDNKLIEQSPAVLTRMMSAAKTIISEQGKSYE
ncbi:ATP-dependent endonuclease [Enterococcus casseliflavus]|nr:ATP-dependent endonuclease [Enterococcus casseliflavus]